MRRRNAIPRTERAREARERALAALALMRRKKLSLTAAAKAEGTSPRTVRRYVGSALRQKGLRGRYKAKPRDRLLRVLRVPSREEEPREIAIRDSRQARRVAEYSNAVERYLQTGDASALQKFRGKHITDASGTQVPLLTDLDELDRLGSAGVLSFESLYARST